MSDTQRLDWLEKHDIWVDVRETGFDDVRPKCCAGKSYNQTVREMIDEEIKKEGAK